MARMRTIKPETFTSETLAECSVAARWTFAGLWTYCDDEGRGRADPRLVKAAVWPLDDEVTSKDVAAYLDELESQRLICRYEAQGKAYLHVVNFGEHQKPNRPVPSKLPGCSRTTHGGLSEDSVRTREHLAQASPKAPANAPDPKPPPELANSENGAPNPGESAGHEPLSEDSVSAHGGVQPTSFTNTPTPTPLLPTEGDGDGDGDVGGDAEKTTPAKPLRDDVERLCKHLADRIEANGNKRPSVGAKWRDAARLMLDLDKRTEDQIHAAIDWCQNSEFWRHNVMSMPKLREQYDRLRMQAESELRKRGPSGTPPAPRKVNFTDEEYNSGW